MANRDLINEALGLNFSLNAGPKEDYSYVNLQGVDLLTNTDAIKDVREYYAAQGVTFNNYSEMWDKFYGDRRWNDVNTLGAAGALVESTLAGDDRDRLARLSKIWANAPQRGSTLDRVWDYGKAAVLDPTNLIPVAGQAAKAKTAFNLARTAGKTLEQSKSAARVAGAKQAGKQEFLIGGAVGGGLDAMQQATEIQQGVSDGFDIARLGTSIGLDATLSGAAGFGLDKFGTSSVGRSLPVVNRFLGGDYADNVAEWQKTSTLGQNLTTRTQALARERDALDAQLADESLDLDQNAVQDQIEAIDMELADIEADGAVVDELNTKLDDLAKQIQDGQKSDIDTTSIRSEYNKTLKKYQSTINKKRLPSRARMTEEVREGGEFPGERTPEFRSSRQTDAEAEGEVKVDAEADANAEGDTAKFTSVRVGEDVNTVEGNNVRVENTTEEEAVDLPDFKPSKGFVDTLPQLLETNKDIITTQEVKSLINEGKIRLTPTTKEVGATGMKDLQKIIDERRATPEVVSEDDVTDATKDALSQEASKTEGDAAEKAPIPEEEVTNPRVEKVESQTDDRVRELMKAAEGLDGDPIVAIQSRLLNTEAFSGFDTPKVRERLFNLAIARANTQVEPRDIGSPTSDPRIAAQLKQLRKDKAAGKITEKQFNELNRRLRPEFGRKADRTQVSMDRLEDVPPFVTDMETGRMVKNPDFVDADQGVPSAIKKSKNIGGSMYATDATGMRPPEFSKSSVKVMVEKDAAKGQGKLYYGYTSFVGDRHADGVTDKADGPITAYYVPVTGKSFKNLDVALKAMQDQGINVNAEYDMITGEDAPIFTDKQFTKEKQKIVDKLEKKSITKEEFNAQVQRLEERAQNAMVTPTKVDVVGRNGEIIERVKAGIPNTRGNKIIAAIPRKEFDSSGRIILSKVLTKGQVDSGKSAEALIGNENAKDWYIGYVPASMRNKKSDMDAMIEAFEPLNDSNKVGEINRTDPTAPPAPLDLQSRGDTIRVDTNTLTTDELNSLYFAYSLARTKNINLIGDIRKPDDIHAHNVTLRDLTRLETIIDNAPWEIDYTINGQTIPMNNKQRLKILDVLHGLNGSIAPNGVRRPAIDIETSIEQVNSIITGASPTTRKNIERMIRLIVPDTLAPIFESADMDADVLGRYVNDRNDALNRIQLNSDAIGNTAQTKGLSETHIVGHELGHWLYNNLLSNRDKKEFWGAINGYYDAEGRLYKDGDRDAMRDIALRSPYFKGTKDAVGFGNALDTPAEYFANQFALFMNHKFDLMMWPNEPFFKKSMKLVKKLWYIMSRKEILDPELEPIFDKLIKRKDLQMRKQFLRPKEPSNKFSLTLLANYENLRVGRGEVNRALENADIGTFIEKIKEPEHGLEAQLRRLTASEKDAKAYARRKGEDFKGYSGMLEAVAENGVGGKLKGIVTRLEQLGIGRERNANIRADGAAISVKEVDGVLPPGKDPQITTATEYPLEDYQALRKIFDEEIVPTIDKAMTQINDAYYRLEHGDIPTAQLDAITIENRKNTGMEAIEKSARADENFKKTKQERGKRQNLVDKAVKALQAKKTTFNEAEFEGFAATEYPDLVPLVSELEEVAKKVPKFKDSKKAIGIATKMKKILLTKVQVSGPATVQRTTTSGPEGPYHLSNSAELAAILREGLMGTGDKNKIQNVAWEFTRRGKNNKKPIVPDSPAVINAAKVEAAFNRGGETEVGIGESTPFILSDFLGEIKHRTPQKMNAARKVAMRMLGLGMNMSPSTKTDAFKEFRNVVRRLAANLETDDITQTIRELSKRLYPTHILDDGTRNLLEKTAARMGYDADSVLEQLVIEDVDMQANRVLMQQIKDTLPEVEGFEVEDAINQARDAMRDAIAFSVNGLIDSPKARQRFLPLTMYGNMEVDSVLSRGSPAAVYKGEVPAEFATEYASETLGRLTQASVDAVKDFTGADDVRVFFITGSNVDPMFGNMPQITERPTNTMANMRDKIIDSAPTARKEVVADLIGQSEAVRNGINGMRADGSSSDLGDHYLFDNVVGKEIERFGATDMTKAKAVFLKDDKPAIFGHQMTFKSDVVKNVADAIKRTANSPEIARQVDRAIEDNTGVFTGRQVFETLASVAGGTEELRRIMRRNKFSTLTVDGETVLVSPNNVRGVDSPDLVNAKPLLGEKEIGSGVNNFIMSEARIASDGGEDATKRAANVLEQAGAPKDFLTATMKMRRKRSINTEDAEKIRTVLTTDTQSGIIRRSGMHYVADFAEPADGSGGHYERIHGKMARILQPMTRALSELPDSKDPLGRWFDAGLRQMYDTTAEALSRRFGNSESNLFGFNPTRADKQPKSHERIVTALQNESGVKFLRSKEKEVYNMLRGYLDEVRSRLTQSGENVGNIAEDYFPQVWRTDLINARRPEFESMLADFLMAEDVNRHGGNAMLKKREALEKAKRITKNIVEEDDGVNIPREQVFNDGDGSEAFLKQRMLRLDQHKEFLDPTNQKKFLGGFLERDLMVVMSKYSENVERRLDISERFGPQAHGLKDYMAIIRNRHDAVERLLSSDKILKSDYHVLSSGNEPDLHGAAVFKQTANSALFKAPFASKENAEFFTNTLVRKAASGANKDDMIRDIMDLMAPTENSDEFSDQMRKNFRKRAEAIASALEDTRGFTKFPSEDNAIHAETFIDLLMQKPRGSEAWRKASSALRMVNGVTLLSFTTLTSLGDLVLPLIRSGNFKAWTSALKNFSSDPVSGSAYRDMIRNTGVAVENTVHQRMANSYGIDANRFTTGFFTATGLTPWTDMMREIAGATAYEHFKASARIAIESPNTRQGRIAKRALDEFGLQELYQKGAPHIDMIMRSGGTQAEHPMYEKIGTGMIKLANESIFAPNKNDLPQWATTPFGQIIFQLKSFPLKMLRLGRYAFSEALRSDDPNYAPALLYMTAGPAMGFTAANVKDVVQMRGGEDNREAEFRERRLSKTVTPLEGMLSQNADKALGWYWDGFMTMGGLGILGELMYDTVQQADNGAYGQVRIAQTFAGPSTGLFFDALTVVGGGMSATGDLITGEGTNGKERAAVRNIVSRVPVLGQMSGVREKAVDLIAGEKGARG